MIIKKNLHRIMEKCIICEKEKATCIYEQETLLRHFELCVCEKCGNALIKKTLIF